VETLLLTYEEFVQWKLAICVPLVGQFNSWDRVTTATDYY